jgi:hypothetical protein
MVGVVERVRDRTCRPAAELADGTVVEVACPRDWHLELGIRYGPDDLDLGSLVGKRVLVVVLNQ